jgi:hypothetical protein
LDDVLQVLIDEGFGAEDVDAGVAEGGQGEVRGPGRLIHCFRLMIAPAQG